MSKRTQAAPGRWFERARARSLVVLIGGVLGVGGVLAQVSVADSGTPTYRLAIELPPGIAGHVPTVGLTYSAAGVDGPTGYGWSLDGTSAITRCHNIKAIDGTTLAGLTNTASDKLCLDGQRLIQTDAAGGVSASQVDDSLGLTTGYREFRTERDSFARIRAYGAAGGNAANGPAYFKVWTKAGKILEYGTATNSTASATITPTGSSVATTWALSRTSDVLGNYVDYQYDVRTVAWGTGPAAGPTSGMEWNLSEIRYTGTASSAPANRVSFVYEDRPASAAAGQAHQRAELFHLGAKSLSVRRLVKIQTFINVSSAVPVKVKTYSISYDNSSTSSRSRILQVAECVGASESPCLPPTRFEYSSGIDEAYTDNSNFASGSLANLSLHSPGTYVRNIPVPGASRSTVVADFNGDGKADLLRWGDNPVDNALYFSNGDGTFTQASAFNIADNLFHSNGCYSTYVGDFNGDGLPDLFRFKAVTGWSGSAYVPCTGTSDLYLNQGDGSFTRIVTSGLPVIQPAISLSTCGTAPPGDPCGDVQGWTRGETFYVIDVDGDGYLDIIHAVMPVQPNVLTPPENPCASIVCTRLFLGNGTGVFTEQATNLANRSVYSPPQGIQALGQPSHIADIDGNGLMDLVGVGYHAWNGFNSSWRSRGDGNFDEQTAPGLTSGDGVCATPLDVNGDGRSDCLTTYFTSAASTAHLSVSTSSTTVGGAAAFNLGAAGLLVNNDLANKRPISGVLAYDFNGDGRTDLLRWHDDPLQNTLYLSNGDGSFRPSATFNLNQATTSLKSADNNVVMLLGDFSGRGQAEILRLHSGAGTGGAERNRLYVRAAGAEPPDLLKAVVSPMGLRTTITWVPLGNPASGSLGSRYASDRSFPGTPNANSAVYPKFDVPPSSYVVATVAADSGIGSSQLITEYAYAGLKASFDGRGSLGFREIRRQVPAADGSQITVYSRNLQTFPYTGMAKQGQTRWGRLDQPSAQLLAQTSNTYCERTASAAAQSAATMDAPCATTTKVQRTYLMQSVESNWDLGSNPLPMTTTTRTINDTGDPLQISVQRQGTAAGVSQTTTRTTSNQYFADNTACTSDTSCSWILGRLQQTTQANSVPNSFASITSSAGTAAFAIATSGTRSNQAASLTDIAFGNVGIAGSSTLTATIASTGLSALTITAPSAASVIGTDFGYASTTCGATLAAGSTCSVTVRFAPTALASRTGSLVVATGAGNLTSSLTGSGTGSVATVVSGAAFGTTALGSAVANQAITVRNDGNVALTLTPGGFNSPYALVSNTCSGVAPGASCSVTLSMSSSAIGTFNQAVTLTGGSTGAVTAAVSGVITGSAATVTANATFGFNVLGAAVANQSVTVRNDGNSPLTLTASGYSTPYSLVSSGCSAVAPGVSCSITFAMSSATIGTYSQTLTLSGASTGSINASLSGTVTGSVATITSGSLAFGARTLDAAAPSLALAVRNDGNTALTLSGLSGLAAPFSVTGNSCSAVAPGASCSVTVAMVTSGLGSWSQTATTAGANVNASSGASGSVSGSIATFVGDSGLALDLGSVGQGGTAPTRRWAFRNDGNAAMTLSLSALNSPFTATNGCGTTVSPGVTCNITVALGTGTVGMFSQSGISVSGANRGSRSDLSVSGSVIPSNTTASASPTTLSWSSVPKGSSQTRSLTLTNTGAVTATGLAYAISYTATSTIGNHFVSGGTCPAAGGSLAAGSSCTLIVTFGANCTGGTRNGTLTISGNFSAIPVALNASVTSAGSCL